ncbi:ribosome maturation factor RimM [Chloroflexota bacterium]
MKPSESEFITIGKILSSWGTEGKLRVLVTTDFPQRFDPSSEVYLHGQTAIIESVEWRKGQAIIKLDIVNNIEKADKLKGELIEIHSSQLQSLPDGQYYHFQLIGLEVRTNNEEVLGEITEIITMSSNDTYVVKGKRGEILIPAIEEVIKTVDLDKGYIVIEPIKGLLDLNEKAAK